MPRRRASPSKESAFPLDLFEVPVCCLCGLGAAAARCYRSPELISLSPLSRSSSSLADLSTATRYVHEECAQYSDGLKEHAARWLKARSRRGGAGTDGQGPALTLPATAVGKELERSATRVCVVCRKHGAYLTCKEASCNYSFHLHCAVSAAQINKALFSQQSCELVCCLHEASLGSARGARAPMSLGDVDGETAEEAVVDGLNEPAARSRSASPVPRPSRRAQSQPCVKRDLRSRTPAARRGRGRSRKVSFAEEEKEDDEEDKYKDDGVEKDLETVVVRGRMAAVPESPAAPSSPRRTRSNVTIPPARHAPRARSAEPVKRVCDATPSVRQPKPPPDPHAPASSKLGLSRYVGCKVRVTMEGSRRGQRVFKEGVVHANTNHRRKRKLPHVIKYFDADESDEEVRLPDSTVEVLEEKISTPSPVPSPAPSPQPSPVPSSARATSTVAEKKLKTIATRVSGRFSTKSSRDDEQQTCPKESPAVASSKASKTVMANEDNLGRTAGDMQVHSDKLSDLETASKPPPARDSTSHKRDAPEDSAPETDSSADESRLSLVMRYRMNLIAGTSGSGMEVDWFYGKTVLLNVDDELKEAAVVRNPGMRRRNGASSNLPHLLRFVDRRERDQEFHLPDDRVTVLVDNPPPSGAQEVSSAEREATKVEVVELLDDDDDASQGDDVADNADGIADTQDADRDHEETAADSDREDEGANTEAAHSDDHDQTTDSASKGAVPAIVGRATRSKGGGTNVQAPTHEMSSAGEGCGPVTRKTRGGSLQQELVKSPANPAPAGNKQNAEEGEEDPAASAVKGPEWYFGKRVLVRRKRLAAREAVVHQNPRWSGRAGSRTRASAPELPHVLKFLNPDEADETTELPHESVTVLEEDDVHWRQALKAEEPRPSRGGYPTRSSAELGEAAAAAFPSKRKSEAGTAQMGTGVDTGINRAERRAVGAEEGRGDSTGDPYLGRRVRVTMSKGRRPKEGVVLPNTTAKWRRRKMYPHLIRYDDSNESDEECMLPDSSVTLLPPVALTEGEAQDEEQPRVVGLHLEDRKDEKDGEDEAMVDTAVPDESDGSREPDDKQENDPERNADNASVKSDSTEMTKCLDEKIEQRQVERAKGEEEQEEPQQEQGDNPNDGDEPECDEIQETTPQANSSPYETIPQANSSPDETPAPSPHKETSPDPGVVEGTVSTRLTRNSSRSAHPSAACAPVATSSATSIDVGEGREAGGPSDSVDQIESSDRHHQLPAVRRVKVVSKGGQTRFGTLHDNDISKAGRSKQLPQVVRFSDGAQPRRLDVRLPDPRVHVLGDAADARSFPAAKSPETFQIARAAETWHAGSRSPYPPHRAKALPRAPEAVVHSLELGSGDAEAGATAVARAGATRPKRGRAADLYAGRRARVMLDDEYKECVVQANAQATAKRRKRFPHVLKYLDSDESDEEVKLPLASVEFISDVEDEGRFEIGGDEEEAEQATTQISPTRTEHRDRTPPLEATRTRSTAPTGPTPSAAEESSAPFLEDGDASGGYRDARTSSIAGTPAAASAAASEALAALAALADRPPAPATTETSRDLDRTRRSSERGNASADPTISLADLLAQHSPHPRGRSPAPVAYQHGLQHNTHPKLAQKAVEADLKRVRMREQSSSPAKPVSARPTRTAGNQMAPESTGTKRSSAPREGARAGSAQGAYDSPPSEAQPPVVNLRNLRWGVNAARVSQISRQTSSAVVAAVKQESEDTLAARTREAGASTETSGAQRRQEDHAAQRARQEPPEDQPAPSVAPGSESTHDTALVESDARQETGSDTAAKEAFSALDAPEQEPDPELAPVPPEAVDATENRVSFKEKLTFRKKKRRGEPLGDSHQSKEKAMEDQAASAARADVDRVPLPLATHLSLESTEGVASIVETSSSSFYHSTASEVLPSDNLEMGDNAEAAGGGDPPMEPPPCSAQGAETMQGVSGVVSLEPESEEAAEGTLPKACDGGPADQETEVPGALAEAIETAPTTTPGPVQIDEEAIQAARAAVETARANLEAAIQEKSHLTNQVPIAATESPETATRTSPVPLQRSTRSMTTSKDADINSVPSKEAQALALAMETPQTTPPLPRSTRSTGMTEPPVDRHMGAEPSKPSQQCPAPRTRNKRKPSAPTAYNAETRFQKFAKASKMSPSKSARRGRRASSIEDNSLARRATAARHSAAAVEFPPSDAAEMTPMDAHPCTEQHAAATPSSLVHPPQHVEIQDMVSRAPPHTENPDKDHHSETMQEMGEGAAGTSLGMEDPETLREQDQGTSKAEPRASPEHPYVVVAALAVLAHAICGQQPTEVKRLIEQGRLWDKAPRSTEAELLAESAADASAHAGGKKTGKGVSDAVDRRQGTCADSPEGDMVNLQTAPMITDWVWAATVAQMMVLPPQAGGQDWQDEGDSGANKQKRTDGSRNTSHATTKRRKKNTVVDHDVSMQVAEKRSPDVLVLQDVIAKEEHAAVWNIEVLQPVLAKLKAKQLVVAQLQQTSRVHMKSVQEQIEILQSNIAHFKRQNV